MSCHLMRSLPFHDASLKSANVNFSLKYLKNLTWLTKNDENGEKDVEIIVF